jgi:hypothetical protein
MKKIVLLSHTNRSKRGLFAFLCFLSSFIATPLIASPQTAEPQPKVALSSTGGDETEDNKSAKAKKAKPTLNKKKQISIPVKKKASAEKSPSSTLMPLAIPRYDKLYY